MTDSNDLVEPVAPNHPADDMAMDIDSGMCDNATDIISATDPSNNEADFGSVANNVNVQEERGQPGQAKDVAEPG